MLVVFRDQKTPGYRADTAFDGTCMQVDNKGFDAIALQHGLAPGEMDNIVRANHFNHAQSMFSRC